MKITLEDKEELQPLCYSSLCPGELFYFQDTQNVPCIKINVTSYVNLYVDRINSVCSNSSLSDHIVFRYTEAELRVKV